MSALVFTAALLTGGALGAAPVHAAGPPGPIVSGCNAANNVPTAIPDNGTVLNRTVSTAGCVFVQAPTQAIVSVQATHPRAGDLELTLISPDGTAHPLKAANPADQSQNLDATWVVDLVNQSSFTARAAVAGPDTWTLRTRDVVTGQAGTLNGWQLSI